MLPVVEASALVIYQHRVQSQYLIMNVCICSLISMTISTWYQLLYLVPLLITGTRYQVPGTRYCVVQFNTCTGLPVCVCTVIINFVSAIILWYSYNTY